MMTCNNWNRLTQEYQKNTSYNDLHPLWDTMSLCQGVSCVHAALLNTAQSYWFLVRGREVIVLGLHLSSDSAVDFPITPYTSCPHKAESFSRPPKHQIAWQVVDRVATRRRVLIGPASFCSVMLGRAMRRRSPEDVRTLHLLQEEPFIPAIQSQTAALSTSICTVPSSSPQASIMVIYAWKNQCISHSLFSKHVNSGYLSCKPDELMLKCSTERCVLMLFAIVLPSDSHRVSLRG